MSTSYDNSTNENKEIPFYLIITSLISIGLVLVILIMIIIYFVWKFLRRNQVINKVLIEEQNKNIINQQKPDFKSIPNSSLIGSDQNRQNMSLSEIKEKNLKDEIHNIIHSANSGSGSDGDRKKRKKKGSKKSNRSNTSPREDSLENDDNEISTKKEKNKKQNKKTYEEENE